jgi:hypothetical protein
MEIQYGITQNDCAQTGWSVITKMAYKAQIGTTTGITASRPSTVNRAVGGKRRPVTSQNQGSSTSAKSAYKASYTPVQPPLGVNNRIRANSNNSNQQDASSTVKGGKAAAAAGPGQGGGGGNEVDLREAVKKG